MSKKGLGLIAAGLALIVLGLCFLAFAVAMFVQIAQNL